MSTNYHVYIGFMAKVDLSKKVKIAMDTIGCQACKTDDGAVFCRKCGGKNRHYTKERETVIDVNDVLDEADLLDDYYSPSYDSKEPSDAYILCNQEQEYVASFSDDDYGEEYADIPRQAKPEEIENLTKVLDKAGLECKVLHGVYTYWA